MKEEILLIGGGGHCKSVIDVIEQEDKYIIAGIIDKIELLGSDVLGYKVIGCDDDLVKLRDKYSNAIVTVGHIKSNSLRVKLFNLLKGLNFNLPKIISPLAYVSNHSKIDEGTIVMHHALVNASSQIGENCIINTKALIEHDCVVENNCHVSTGAIVNGGVVVKENTFFGSNATSKEYIEVNDFIKAGSVVK
ncbi:NeuD/PglB/VioB family sugar acetyltransferase [Sulfurimonas sp.]|jgi:sugar O-acyltransferase (sialic acid O-acetyltransferase NeuD family)|uniref:NeuD/PglB/VioB family sugar acetyltransferase n=1 Tax=Sulfurimonas sp. TaxID=2022749 RepID=UPI0025F859E7|nr:NeuD/PglB/VioB family sugar acetyltransferase [Sulfurimonas sp.]MBT5935158.1 NeuD/PglB/VioB family sugar acetyltransferase [Sulfurimonas sp.]